MPVAASPGSAHPDEQIASLRGAAPRPIDGKKLRDIVVGICAVALIALSVTFFATGFSHNSAVTDLQQHGVRVKVKVLTCAGQLGGSGSNNAGYSCQGTFVLLGKRYQSTLPDNAAHAPGTTVVDVTPSDDPGHLTTLQVWKSQHTSASLFIIGAILGVAGLVIAGLLIASITRRRRQPRTTAAG
jgi:hypothetical protein